MIRFRGLLLALCVVLLTAPAQAQLLPPLNPFPSSGGITTLNVPTISATGTMTRPGTAHIVPVIYGASVCTLILSGGGTFSVQPELFTSGLWDFATTFGTITSAGTYVSVIDYTKVSEFSFVVTSIGSGQTLTYTEACGPPATAITVQ